MLYYDDFSELSFSEKETYIGEHFGSMFCGYNMDKIDQSSLSDCQKQQIKDHLFYYGD